MNHIQRITQENAKLRLALEDISSKIGQFRSYLASPKFTGHESDGSRKDWISTGELDRWLTGLFCGVTLDLNNAERETLKPVFDMVCDKDDWKAPIHAHFNPNEVAQDTVKRAVMFFTATEATFTPITENCTRVESIGYRAGPAGDH